MRRVPDSNYPVRDLFGKGKHGFGPGDKTNGTIATIPGAAFMNAVQEEIAGVIEGLGVALDPENNNQLGETLLQKMAVAVESVAALRELDGSKLQMITLAGYYAGQPGRGGGVFVADAADTASPDNGGTIIVDSVGTRWKRQAGEIDIKHFGALGNDRADDTAALNRALDWAETSGQILHFSDGIYRITTPIVRNQASWWQGGLVVEKRKGGADIQRGSWLHIDHNGTGIRFDGSDGYFTGVKISGMGIIRNQPEPAGASWQPTANGYDFWLEATVSAEFADMLHFRSNKGYYCGGNKAKNTGVGRMNFYRIRGQFFEKGIVIDHAYDTCRIDQLHAWTFWRDSELVHQYTHQNLDVIHLYRCDNPLLSNIFSIFARSGLRCSQGDAGGVAKFKLTQADFDRGHHGLWVDASNKNQVTGMGASLSAQGETDSGNSVLIEGNNSKISLLGLHAKMSGGAAVRVGGTGNLVTCTGLIVEEYDSGNTGQAAVEVADFNRINILGKPEIAKTTGNGSGGKYSYTGFISVDDWRSYTPAVQGQNGVALDNVTSDCLYKLVGTTVSVRIDLSISANGTAAGNLQVKRPPYLSSGVWVSGGREIKKGGKAVTLTLENAWDYILINNYDNTYPVADGTRIVGTINYAI